MKYRSKMYVNKKKEPSKRRFLFEPLVGFEQMNLSQILKEEEKEIEKEDILEDEEKNNENKEQNIEIKKEEKNEIIENNIKTGDNIYLSFIILTIVIIAQAMINKPKKGKRMKK